MTVVRGTQVKRWLRHLRATVATSTASSLAMLWWSDLLSMSLATTCNMLKCGGGGCAPSALLLSSLDPVAPPGDGGGVVVPGPANRAVAPP